MLTVALVSGKGGVGKTSDTTGLAATAGRRGLNVVTVDADPRATATEEMGVTVTEDTLTLNDLLWIPDKGEVPDPGKLIDQYLQPAGEGWPASIRVLPAEIALDNRQADANPIEYRLAEGLAGLTGVDLVLIDTPPRPGGKLIIAALAAADLVLYPATLTTDGKIGVEEAKRTVGLIRRRHNPRLREAGILRSNVPTDRKAVHRQIDRDLEEMFPGEVLPMTIPSYAIREEARYSSTPATAAAEMTRIDASAGRKIVAAYGEVLDHLLSLKEAA